MFTTDAERSASVVVWLFIEKTVVDWLFIDKAFYRTRSASVGQLGGRSCLLQDAPMNNTRDFDFSFHFNE
jgi:hypothetical protein